jgi:glycosyltransferase involved in cell wall biosynthesis
MFVFVTSRTAPTLGRVERHWLKVMRALIAEGAAVHLICTPRAAIEIPARALGVEMAPYRLDRFNLLITRSRMRKYLRRHEPVVVLSTGYEADVLVRWAARQLPVKVVSALNCGGWPPKGLTAFDGWVRKRLDRDSAPRVDAFSVDCRELADELVASGIARSRIRVNPPTVDLARIADEARVRVELPHARPLVGYAGALERSRGLATLATAAPAIARDSGAHVLVAGSGGHARAALLAAAREGTLTLLDRVESVPAVLAAFDVCCFPSVAPGVPTSLLEAAALGRPIVASDVAGIRELFGEDEIVLVRPSDAAALAEAVVALLEDPVAACAMGERARHRIVDEYSAASGVRRQLDMLRELLG